MSFHVIRITTAVISATLLMFQSYAQDALSISVEQQIILEHDDGKSLWFHPRACAIPNSDGHIVMTIQQHLQKSDYYSGLYVMHSRDNGATWTDPDPRPELAWRDEAPDVTVSVCDVTPGWHAPSGKLIAIGVKVRYRDGVQVYEKPQSHAAAYTVYDPKEDSWSEWQFVDMPDQAGKFYLVTPGCVQWHVRDDGQVLVPMYFRRADEKAHHATIVQCRFDGETLVIRETRRGVIARRRTRLRRTIAHKIQRPILPNPPQRPKSLRHDQRRRPQLRTTQAVDL